MSTDPAAVVRHITKNHVTIAPSKGWSVAVFNLTGHDVEALVIADDGSETVRLLVAGPGENQTMSIKTIAGVVDIKYAETEDGRP